MNSLLYIPTAQEYDEIVDVWEASVRATHHFLPEEDIVFFKSLIRQEYLQLVNLFCIRDSQHRILGFVGIAENKIEMLFVHPAHQGGGIGRTLLQYVIEQCNVHQVDVNEQNPQAVGFYQKFGFEVRSRSETDGLGKPYPLLHMELKQR